MIAVDTNVLVYAHREESPQHDRGLEAVRALAEGEVPWGLPVFVLGDFLRVVTHPRVYSPPTSRTAALAVVEALLASPTVRLLSPGDRFWPLLQEAVEEGQVTGNRIFDAQVVAVCREHGVGTILSEDRDFRRFPSITLQTL
ncbi:MAG TPA: TA system VapC family ribonuclease toxin [Acidimicrobiales bacterium]|nr:TA system VapC family ribonuclease toxin [Acidimicrobiales bacterium]